MKSCPRCFLLCCGLAFYATAQAATLLPDDEVQAAARRIDESLDRLTRLHEQQKNARLFTLPGRAADEVFLRRLYVDVAGRLPVEEEVREFLASDEPGKRSRWINRVSADRAASAWRFQRLTDTLRVVDEVGGVPQREYIQWLQNMTRADTPYDQMMAAMLTATGSVQTNPASGLLLRDEDRVLRVTTEITRSLLAVDLTCAACHNDPYQDTTQKQFYEFASTLNRVKLTAAPQREALLTNQPQALALPPRYLYRDGRPGEVLTPTVLSLSGAEERATLALCGDVTAALAKWMIEGQAERFQNVAMLRVWGWMFGQPRPYPTSIMGATTGLLPDHLTGLDHECQGPAQIWPIAQILDHDDANNRLNDEFLTTLRTIYQQCQLRLGEFQRVLAHTRAYQREALLSQEDGSAYASHRIYPAPLLRRLPAEIIWDCMAGWPGGKTSTELPQVLPASHPLRLLGRGSRQWADENSTSVSAALSRYMINGEAIQLASRSPQWQIGTPQQKIERVFLSLVGRFPSAKEMKAAMRYHDESGSAAIPDIVWAVLNTSEFIFER